MRASILSLVILLSVASASWTRVTYVGDGSGERTVSVGVLPSTVVVTSPDTGMSKILVFSESETLQFQSPNLSPSCRNAPDLIDLDCLAGINGDDYNQNGASYIVYAQS